MPCRERIYVAHVSPLDSTPVPHSLTHTHTRNIDINMAWNGVYMCDHNTGNRRNVTDILDNLDISAPLLLLWPKVTQRWSHLLWPEGWCHFDGQAWQYTIGTGSWEITSRQQRGSRESEWEVGQGCKLSHPNPSDRLPPLKAKGLPETVPPTQVFKYLSLGRQFSF